jgi:uncharacterized lipoprotein YmbA
MKTKPLLSCTLLAAMVVVFSSCMGTSPSSRFYTLTPLPEKMGSGAGIADGALNLGIGPIRLAEYLRQPHLVTRAGDSQLKVADFDRWAGTFEDNFVQVVVENMSALLGTDHIYVYPFQAVLPVDYQIVLNVVRFDGELGKSASLVVRWSILRGADKTPLVIKRSSIDEPSDDSDYTALVGAQSRAVARLCREMAVFLNSDARVRPSSGS